MSSPAGLATFYPSASCPTVTLDLTQPSIDLLKFQRAISSNHCQQFPTLPLHGYNRTQQYSDSKPSSTMIPASEKSLALVDVVSAAIIKDPSIKAALDAAVSSLITGDTLNINN